MNTIFIKFKIQPLIIIQLSQLEFTSIGAISEKLHSKQWTVSRRPLTYNMNEIATVVGYPISEFPTTGTSSTREFLRSLVSDHQLHLLKQRNLAEDLNDAERRLIARHHLMHLNP